MHNEIINTKFVVTMLAVILLAAKKSVYLHMYMRKKPGYKKVN